MFNGDELFPSEDRNLKHTNIDTETTKSQEHTNENRVLYSTYIINDTNSIALC